MISLKVEKKEMLELKNPKPYIIYLDESVPDIAVDLDILIQDSNLPVHFECRELEPLCDWELGKDFEFCNCGMPAETIELISRFLTLIKNKDSESYFHLLEESNDALMYFFFYTLNRLGFLDHAFSVPGFLTEKGKELEKRLRQKEK